MDYGTCHMPPKWALTTGTIDGVYEKPVQDSGESNKPRKPPLSDKMETEWTDRVFFKIYKERK